MSEEQLPEAPVLGAETSHAMGTMRDAMGRRYFSELRDPRANPQPLCLWAASEEVVLEFATLAYPETDEGGEFVRDLTKVIRAIGPKVHPSFFKGVSALGASLFIQDGVTLPPGLPNAPENPSHALVTMCVSTEHPGGWATWDFADHPGVGLYVEDVEGFQILESLEAMRGELLK